MLKDIADEYEASAAKLIGTLGSMAFGQHHIGKLAAPKLRLEDLSKGRPVPVTPNLWRRQASALRVSISGGSGYRDRLLDQF